eukprot:3803222-Amphidinium_carterae.1
MLLVAGGSFFSLAVIKRKRQTLPMYGSYAWAKSVWYETCQQQRIMFLASCVLLPLYSRMLPLACMVVEHHLRFHVA